MKDYTVWCLSVLCATAGLARADKPVEEWVFPKREVHRETVLVARGEATGAVVYPAADKAYKALAERIRDRVTQATGVALPLLADEAVVPEWCGPLRPEYRRMPLVLLGDINHNRATFPLYARYLCECDANYPGKGGRVLRTVVAPYHMTANHIVLAGPGLTETAAAVEQFLEIAQKQGRRGELTVPPLLDVSLSEDWGEVQRVAPKTKPIAPHRPTYVIANAAKRYLLTGHPVPAQAVRNWFTLRAKVAKGFVTSDYGMEALTRAWELTCDSGLYTPEEIQGIETKLLHTLFYQQRQYWRCRGPRTGMGTRHHSAGTYAFLLMAEMLRRHCPDDTDVAKRLDTWIAECKAFFRSFPQRRCYHGERDSNSVFQVMGVLFSYALREGELDLFTNDTARQGIRKALAVIDNLGYGAGLQNYEDTYPGHVRTAYLVGEPLGMAAFYYRDPYMKWLTQHWPGCHLSTWFAHGYGREHAFATGLDAKPPAGQGFSGFVPAAAMGDRYRRAAELGRATVSAEQAFDKLSLRGAFDPQETYLVIQGMEPIIDWRDDANSIIRMTERGRICLFHNNKWPSRFHKNGVLVSSGFGDAPPRAARLDLVANFEDAAFAQTTLPKYRGTDWTRRTLWLRSRFTLVLDDVTVAKPGEYSATCAWRTPTSATLDGRRWSSRLHGVDFHVVSDALMPSTTEPEPMVGWEIGNRGSGLRQMLHAQAAAGQALRFRNLLYTAPAAQPRALDVRRLGEQAALVVGAQGKWLAGFGGCALAPIETDAALFIIGTSRAHLAQATFLRIRGQAVWEAAQPTDAAVDTDAERALVALWAKGMNPRVAPPSTGPAAGPFKVAWTYHDFAQEPQPIAGIRAATVTGSPSRLSLLVDGELGGSSMSTVGFAAAPDLLIDLNQERRITRLRIWTGAHKANSGEAKLRDPIEARIAFGNTPDLAGAAEKAVTLQPGCRFCELYKTEVYACHYHEAAGLDAAARYVRLKLPATVRGLRELEVFSTGMAQPELLDACAADLDGQGEKEWVVTSRTGEVVALSADGRKLWSKMLPGEPLAVEAGNFTGDARQEVIVSALDGGLRWFDLAGAEHRIAPWPQKCGRLQYDFAFSPGQGPRPLYTSSYYDVAEVRPGQEPKPQNFFSMWCYNLLPPTHDLDAAGGLDFVTHDIYGRTSLIDTADLKPRRVWGTVRGRLSHWQLVDLPGQETPGLLIVGWDGLGMYRIDPAANPSELWRREDGVRLFCGMVTDDGRVLVGKADGFVAEFSLDGKLLGCHWVGWPVKALAQIATGKRSYTLVGTDGGLFCFDESWRLRQSLPGSYVKLLPIESGGKASVLALVRDGKVQRLDHSGPPG